MSDNFHENRLFALEHFYVWENGEDFDWLQREWEMIGCINSTDKEYVEQYILTLAHIYDMFCHECYEKRCSIDDFKKYRLTVDDTVIEHPADRLKKANQDEIFDDVLDSLICTYVTPEEIAKQFIGIGISYLLPHEDGVTFIYKLFEGRWDPSEVDYLNSELQRIKRNRLCYRY